MKRYQTGAAYLFTFFEHYDKALFVLCIPFLSPLFFPTTSSLTQLIWGYALIPISTLARPLGAFIFGRLGDKGGVQKGLFLSAGGIGLCSIGIAVLPTYETIGLFAPALLTLFRMGQNLCFAGQTTGSALLILENRSSKSSLIHSSLFQSFGAVGALVASYSITLMLQLTFPWRVLFFLGGLTAFLPLFLAPPKPTRQKTGAPIKNHLGRYAAATLVCGFIYANYKILTSMLSGLLPLITSLSDQEVMSMNTWVLGFDLIFITFFGWAGSRLSSYKTMLFASALLAVLAPFTLPSLAGACYAKVFALRLVLLVPSCMLTAPFYHWMKEIAPKGSAYTFIGCSKAAGLQLLGAPAPAFLLYVYKIYGLTGVSLAYSALALLSAVGVAYAFQLVGKYKDHVESSV